MGRFIGLYTQHISVLDMLIIGLGIAVLLLQLGVWGWFKHHGMPGRDRPLQAAKRVCRAVARIAALCIELFPILGLLGTVGALLVTFAGMKGGSVSTNIIADFAPGLTTTISGLAASLCNLIAYHIFLTPMIEMHFPEDR